MYQNHRSKFIQITAGADGVFALDEQGYVWQYEGGLPPSEHTRDGIWQPLSRRRAGDPSPKEPAAKEDLK